MKKMYLVLFGITMFSSLVACQKESLNEIDQIESIDKDKIEVPINRE